MNQWIPVSTEIFRKTGERILNAIFIQFSHVFSIDPIVNVEMVPLENKRDMLRSGRQSKECTFVLGYPFRHLWAYLTHRAYARCRSDTSCSSHWWPGSLHPYWRRRFHLLGTLLSRQEVLRNDVHQCSTEIFAMLLCIDHFPMGDLECFSVRTAHRFLKASSLRITYQWDSALFRSICPRRIDLRSTSSCRNRSFSVATSLSLLLPGTNNGGRGDDHCCLARTSGSCGRNLTGSWVPFPLVPSPRRPSRF